MTVGAIGFGYSRYQHYRIVQTGQWEQTERKLAGTTWRIAARQPENAEFGPYGNLTFVSGSGASQQSARLETPDGVIELTGVHRGQRMSFRS